MESKRIMSNDILKSKSHLKELTSTQLHCISGGKKKDDIGSPPPPPPIFKGDGSINLPPVTAHIGGTDEFAKIGAKVNITENFYISGSVTTDYNNFGNKEIYAGFIFSFK